MPLSSDTKEEILDFLAKQDENFEAKQLLKIRDEVASHSSKAEVDRRGRLQFLSAIGGVSILALSAFAYTEIQTIARESATQAVKAPIAEVEEVLVQIEKIHAQIETSLQAVELTKRNADEILGEVDEALGQVRAAQGGIAIANDLSQIYRRLEQMDFDMRSNGEATSSPGLSIEEFWQRAPARDPQTSDEG